LAELTNNTLDQVLRDPRVEAVQDIFSQHDKRSMSAQRTHRRFALMFIAATALASLAAALILLATGAGEDAGANTPLTTISQPSLRYLLFAVEVVALAVAAFASHIQETRQYNITWDRERRLAEGCRIELFDTFLSVAKEGDIKLQGAAFDHFVSHQLDNQLRFYNDTGVRHEQRTWGFAVVGALVAAVVAAAGVGGISEHWLPLAALIGVVAPVFLTALNSWQNTTNDQEKAQRYAQTWTSLRRLKGQTGIVRNKLSKGDVDQMLAFVAEVHNILRDENVGWQPSKRNETD